MRTPPTNWTALMAQQHETETRVDINNVSYYGYDGESGIWSLATRNALFENFGAGNCHAGQIDLVLALAPMHAWRKYNAIHNYTWDKHNILRTYHWEKHEVNTTYSDVNIGTTGTKNYSHFGTPETRVLSTVPQIVTQNNTAYFDFSAGRQTVVQTDYTPVGSYCVGNNDSIKTASGGVEAYASYYAKVLSISDNKLFDWVSSSDANAEIHEIRATTSKGDLVGVVASTIANAFPQDGVQDGYWYVYTGETHSRGEMISSVSTHSPDSFPQDGEQDGYWYTYVGDFPFKGTLIGEVQAEAADAYPQDGMQDGFWYTYIGLAPPNPNIPPMAKIEVYVRLTNGTLTTAWVRKGVYFIDTREWDAQHEFLTITGYDAMLKAEQPYLTTGDVGQWPKVDTDVVDEICEKLDVELDTRTVLNKGYMVQLPAVSSDGSDSDTVRTVLGYIGAAYGGNWIITEDGTLRLVPLNSGATPIALGMNGIDLQTFPAYDALGIVHLVVSEEAEYTAGTTGRDIEISCPWGTQTMANNLLSALSGYVYQPLTITTEYAADPLWELGDPFTFNGYTSVIADTVQNFGLAFTVDISAPNGEEINHEYPYTDKGTQEIKRVVAKTTASLKVDIDRIEGKVDGKITTYRQSTVPVGASTGDLWYATADVGNYKAGTWYRYSGSAWEETSEAISIPVAPAWETGTQYKKGDVVDSGDKWYAAKINHTASNSNKPPNTTYWEERETISAVTGSQITQMVDGITLSVTSGSSGTKISMQTGGITIDSPLVDMHVKALNVDGNFSADKIKTGTLDADDITVDGMLKVMDGTTQGGYLGYGYGNNGEQNTSGVVLASSKKATYGSADHYLIVTGSGVRMQSGSNAIYVVSDGVHKVVNGVDTEIGEAVFG